MTDWDNFTLMFKCTEDKIQVSGDQNSNLCEIVHKLAWILVVLAGKADVKEEIKTIIDKFL